MTATTPISMDTLSQFEVIDCHADPSSLWRWGNVRDWVNQREGKVKEKKVALPGASDWVAHVSGAAECLVGYHIAQTILGMRHDHLVRHPDDHDLALPDGRKIDVKWSPNDQSRLNCSQTARCIGVADIYVLVTGPDADHLTVRGWARSFDLIRQERLRDFGYGPGKEAFSLGQSALRPLSDIE